MQLQCLAACVCTDTLVSPADGGTGAPNKAKLESFGRESIIESIVVVLLLSECLPCERRVETACMVLVQSDKFGQPVPCLRVCCVDSKPPTTNVPVAGIVCNCSHRDLWLRLSFCQHYK
jgi:hypothetical protein